MGIVAFVCISKKKHLTPTLLYCIRSWGHPLPTCVKKSGPVATAELVVGDLKSMHLEIPQLKSMGNTLFGRFSAIKPQTPSPVILHQFVAA